MVSGERAPRIASSIILSVVTLVMTFMAWAAWADLEEVTRGQGRVIPSSRTQVIQSSEPGVVRDIRVRLGQRVAKGELLMLLDDTPNAAKAGEVEAQERALRAQVARLEAEQSGTSDGLFECPADILRVAPDVCENERRLIAARNDNQQKRLAVFTERVEQRQRELNETQAAIERLTASLKLAERELELLRPMAARKLVAQTELIRAERQVVETGGQLAGANEAIARLGAALREARLQYDEQRLGFRREVLAELTQKMSELSVIQEALRGATERVRRTEIKSPVDGIVNMLNVTTLGGFVNAGDKVLEIVPVEDNLLVEAKIRPSDIAFIHPGQRAVVKITAYDFTQYGGLHGIVEQISADSLFDPNQKEAFYSVIIRTGESQLRSKDNVLTIIPGMVCDVDIITGRKSVLAYLMKPINRARQEALRER